MCESVNFKFIQTSLDVVYMCELFRCVFSSYGWILKQNSTGEVKREEVTNINIEKHLCEFECHSHDKLYAERGVCDMVVRLN